MRSRLPRAERERQMLETAQTLFAQRGYADVTMDEVAAAVGVTKPLLYNYFGNKERLYAACMAPAAEALADALVAAVREAPGEALGRAIHAFFGFLDRDRAGWRVLFDETLPASVAAYREHLAALIVAELPAASNTEPLTVAVLGAAEALGRWWLRTEAMPAATAADLLIATLEPGLRNP